MTDCEISRVEIDMQLIRFDDFLTIAPQFTLDPVHSGRAPVVAVKGKSDRC